MVQFSENISDVKWKLWNIGNYFQLSKTTARRRSSFQSFVRNISFLSKHMTFMTFTLSFYLSNKQCTKLVSFRKPFKNLGLVTPISWSRILFKDVFFSILAKNEQFIPNVYHQSVEIKRALKDTYPKIVLILLFSYRYIINVLVCLVCSQRENIPAESC